MYTMMQLKVVAHQKDAKDLPRSSNLANPRRAMIVQVLTNLTHCLEPQPDEDNENTAEKVWISNTYWTHKGFT